MDREIVLLITGASDAWSRFSIESVGTSFVDMARRKGGAAWAGWTENGLKIRVQGVSSDFLREMLNAYLAAVQKNKETVSVSEQQVPLSSIPDVAAGEIPWGTVLRRKLTKEFLHLLPEGAYVVSNLFGGGEEVFAERVGDPELRDVIWKRAVIAGANNRLCRVVWTKVDFDGVRDVEKNPNQR